MDAMNYVILVLGYLAWTISTVAFAIALALLLRMFLQWMEANPFGWFVSRLRRMTEPFLRPFRYGFDSYTLRFDMIPIVAAAVILLNGLFLGWIVSEIAGILARLSQPQMLSIGRLLAEIVWIVAMTFMAALFARFLLPLLGIGYSNRFLRLSFLITEPLLKPLRRYLVIGFFDLSPLVLLIAVQFVSNLLRGWLMRY